jgi:hypothetical protein
MAAISSGNATLTYNSQLVAALANVTTSCANDMIECTAISDQRKKYLAGSAGTTASAELFYDQGDAGVAAIETQSLNPTAATLTIVYATGMTISGSAFVTGFDVTASTGDICRATANFQFTGTVTIT